MKLKPVFFLRDTWQADAKQLETVAQMGFPVVIEADEFEICSRSHEFFQIFAKEQIHVLPPDSRGPWSKLVALCIEKEWTHVVSLNQFHPQIVEAVDVQISQLIHHPFDFIFFCEPRRQEKKNNPFFQRLLDLEDFDYRQLKSQNGVYPVFYLQNVEFGKGSQFSEVKILLYSLRRRLNYKGIPVAKGEVAKVGGWREKWWDFCLVTLSSLHRNQRPLHSSLSFAMGAFIACTPFYGLQTGLIILLAMLFRLSFPIAFLGSQISLPPIYSLIVPMQIYVGFHVTGTPFNFEGPWLDVARQHFAAWWVGSLLVGSLIASFMGGAWYLAQTQGQEVKINWTGRMRGGRLGNAFMVFVLRKMGLRVCYFLLYFIVPYFYFFAPTARRGLDEYYKIIRSELNWFSRQWAILRHLYVFAQLLVDQAYQASRDEISFDIQYMTGNVLRQHQEPGARLMMFSHFGGWAISTQGFSRRNNQKPMHLIRYQTEALSSEKVFRETNQSNLVHISIKPGEPVFMAIHGVLGEGGQLAIMGDRPFDNNFELKNLLGRLAPIPSTPFRLAKTYGAKLSFVVGFRRGYKSYGLATESHSMEKMNFEQAQQKYLTFFTHYLQQYPTQWFNLYPYWSSLPTLPNGTLCLPQKNNIEKPFTKSPAAPSINL